MRRLIQYQKRAHPQVPDSFWEKFIASVDPDELVELIVPIYDRHLDHQDIRAIIRFYESPAGKKLILVQPRIVRDSMAAGGRWGEELGRRVIQAMRRKGYL